MKTVGILSATLVLMSATSGVMAQAQVCYSLTPITTASGAQLNVYGLNNRGEVVGETSGDNPMAFYWKGGQYKDLSNLIGPTPYYSTAQAINDRSQIVGYYLDETIEYRIVLVEGSTVIDISDVGGPDVPTAINNRGQVVGYGSGKALLWNGSRTQLPDLPSPNPISTPLAINNRGVILGMSNSLDFSRAVTWKPPYDEVTELPVPVGAWGSRASDINERGQAVGYVGFYDFIRSYVWENGTFTELPLLYPDAYSSDPRRINNAGVIVGITHTSNYENVATVWINRVPHDLNELVNGALPALSVLRSANHINDRGQIVAIAADTSGEVTRYMSYLLTPGCH